MNTSQSRLVREAVLRELDAGRYVHIRPRRLPPECLDRVEALADKHGIDREFARRLAAELHRYDEAASWQMPGAHIETVQNPRRNTYDQHRQGTRDPSEARPRQVGPRRTAKAINDPTSCASSCAP